MGRANQMDPNRGVTEEALGVVDEGLGTAYDVVRSVYDSLAGINIVAENIAVITDANDTLEALEEAIALVGSTAADAASALASKNAAAASAVTASTASTNATNRAAEALANATASGISAAAALASQNAASASQTTATTQAGIATSKAAEALASANTASGHATTATNAATAASTSSGTATGAASTATTKAAEAVASAASASGSAGTATTKAAEALASAVAAAGSQSTASTAATTATGAADVSTTKAGEASASATTAYTGATTATTKAAEALASAIAAAAAETAAINAKVLTEAARDATLAAFDSFDDRYLGDKAIAPTVDNDGNALVPGALYFDTTTNPGAMNVYTGVTFGWQAAYVTGDGFAPAIHDHDTRYYQKSEIDIFVAGLQPSIAAGTTAEYWRGDKTWQTLNKAAVGLGSVDNIASATLLDRSNHTGLQDVNTINFTATQRFSGRTTAGAGAGEELTGTQATAMLISATAGSKGLMSAADKSKIDGIASGATANLADATLVARANHTGTQTADTITDGTTNKAFTATEKTKLAGIASGATANSTNATLLNRANHTGTQSADTLTNGTTNGAFLLTERTKLTGIATGATANSADATLLARANHTGTQPISSILAASSSRIFGRVTASGGAGEELTAAQVRTLINVVDGANVGTVTGSFGSGGTTGLTLTGGASSGSVTLTIGGTLAVANGGTGATNQTAACTNLGATSVGHNFFILTNPSAITFPRINADNTVSALSAAAFLTAIGGGVGTITAINGSGGTSGLTLTGGASSGSVTLTIGGTLSTANGGTGITAFGTGVGTALGVSIGSAGAFVTFNGAGGTPSAINLTNGTALPIGGISGLGTNVATKLAAANLGASTVGNNFHTMTNPSAITFPRMNADNTVSALDASTFRGAISAAASGAIGSSGIEMTTNRLVGRNTAGTGAPQEITLGTGLSFTGTTLNCTVTGGVTTMAASSPLSVNTSTGAVTVSLGAQVLRNVTSGYTAGGKVNVGTSAPGSPAAGDLWLDTTITGGVFGTNAWVCFNGTGTIAIKASANVSSITDNGNGDYTVNFTNALADTNYAVVVSVNNNIGTVVGGVRSSNSTSAPTTKTTSAVRLYTASNSAGVDSHDTSVIIQGN